MDSSSSSKTERILEYVEPVKEDAEGKRVVELLGKNHVVVLVDSGSRPIGILTLCDIDRVLNRAKKQPGKLKASDLFEEKSLDYVHTVKVDDPLDVAADEITRRHLDTGIVAVNQQGVYAGYVYTSKLRNYLGAQVDARKEDLRSSADRLKSKYPTADVQLDRWLGPS
jgi:hypothetical protein